MRISCIKTIKINKIRGLFRKCVGVLKIFIMYAGECKPRYLENNRSVLFGLSKILGSYLDYVEPELIKVIRNSILNGSNLF